MPAYPVPRDWASIIASWQETEPCNQDCAVWAHEQAHARSGQSTAMQHAVSCSPPPGTHIKPGHADACRYPSHTLRTLVCNSTQTRSHQSRHSRRTFCCISGCGCRLLDYPPRRVVLVGFPVSSQCGRAVDCLYLDMVSCFCFTQHARQ